MRSSLVTLLCICHFAFGQNTTTKSYLLESFKQAKINKKDTLILTLSKQLASLYAKEMNLDSALFYEKYCNSKFKNVSLPTINIKNLIGLGEIFNMKKEYDSALHYFNKAELFLLNNDTIQRDFLVLTKIRKQQCFFKKQEFEKSLFLLEEANELSEELENSKYFSLIMYSYSQIYYELGENSKAITRLKKAIKTAKGVNESFNYYHSIITMFSKIEEIDSSILYLKKAIDISEKNNRPVFKNIFYTEMVEVLRDSAQKKIFLSKIDTSFLPNYFKSLYFFNKAWATNDLKDRVKNWELTLAFTKDLKLSNEVYSLLYLSFKDIDPKKALFYLEMYNNSKDLINNKERRLKIEKALLNNEIIRKSNELDKHKASKTKNLYFVLLIVFIIMFGLVYVILLYRKQKRFNTDLILEKKSLLKESVRLNKDLAQALFEIEKNISFLESSQKELSEIRNNGKVNSQLNILYARVNQYVNEINRNKEIQNKISALKDDFLLRVDKNVKLTNTEKKLIILIKLNMATKEIAPLLNVTEASVEKYRYRLRKKLNLDKDLVLREYVKNL